MTDPVLRNSRAYMSKDPDLSTSPYPDPMTRAEFRDWLEDKRSNCRHCNIRHSLKTHWEACDVRPAIKVADGSMLRLNHDWMKR
jgi:hypothetical protein